MSIYDPYESANTTVWQNEAAAHAKNAEDSAAIAALKAIAADASEKAAAISAEAARISEENAEKSASQAAQSADISVNIGQVVSNAADRAEIAATNAETSRSVAETSAATATSKAQEASNAAVSAAASASSASENADIVANMVDQAQQINRKMAGYFDTPEELKNTYLAAEPGFWAIVGSTDTIWVWDDDTNSWVDTHKKTDLSDYYTKSQTDEKIAAGEVASAKALKVNIVADGTDYDTLKTPGIYSVASNTKAQTMVNCPTSYAHSIEILTNGHGVRQIVRNYNASANARTYFRNFNGDDWQQWYEYYTSANPQPTVAKLTTARTINGTTFDGSSNIQTATHYSYTILTNGSGSPRYIKFATIAANASVSLLFAMNTQDYSNKVGLWFFSCNTYLSNTTYKFVARATCIAPSNGTTEFGYVDNGNGNYTLYLGVPKWSCYSATVTQLSSNLDKFIWGVGSYSTSKPTGWTDIATTTLQDSTGSVATLSTPRTIQTNLASTSAPEFDGSSNITPGVIGTLPFSNGGTGKTTGVDAANALLNSLTTGDASITDDSTAIITQHITPGTNTYHRRPISKLWDYIKSKTDNLYLSKTSAYTLPLATDSVRGGVKIGYTQNGKNYPVQLSGEQMYVNVPWTDTNTTYTAASAAPKAAGTAAVGTSAKYAREDHVHPAQTTVSGNAGTATTLATARTLTIGDTGKTFNGSANVSWTKKEIGAATGWDVDATAGAAGWYRIAASPSGISNDAGIFVVRAAKSGVHSLSVLEAGTSYGNAASTTIYQLAHHAYSSAAVTKARVVYHTTYSGNYAYVEVYANSASVVLHVRFYGVGWTPVAPSTAGSIPSGYSNKEITFANGSARVAYADSAGSAVDQTARDSASTASTAASAAKTAADAAQTTANAAMPKSGGTFTGSVAAYNTNRTGTDLRNCHVTNSSSSAVSTGYLIFRRK